jgi:hypothetical protein
LINQNDPATTRGKIMQPEQMATKNSILEIWQNSDQINPIDTGASGMCRKH